MEKHSSTVSKPALTTLSNLPHWSERKPQVSTGDGTEKGTPSGWCAAEGQAAELQHRLWAPEHV